MWRLEIQHRTWYEYQGNVSASYNRARLTPCSRDGQLLLDHQVSVLPNVPLFVSTDYWGTRVHTFDIHVPHNQLEVIGSSLVETYKQPNTLYTTSIDWETLRSADVIDTYCEFLAASVATAPDETIIDVAHELAGQSDPFRAVQAIIGWVQDNVVYQRGVTHVHTPAADVVAARAGVCQDFAHLSIALLRTVGIPARYVSGYLHPEPDAELGSRVAGESHAWIEVWLGRWIALDPTNNAEVAERHIRIGHGRDYLDVAPLVGIYHGAPSKALHVSVDLIRHA